VSEHFDRLTIKVFADGADLDGIVALARDPRVSGFTTNPTLMRSAGVENYEDFATAAVAAVPDRPISFEVFADRFDEMERQALKLASLGANVYVKIPVTDPGGEPSTKLARQLAEQGVQLNITAILTLDQVAWVADALRGGPPGIVSVFAGRIADTGRDPVPIMAAALELLRTAPNLELLWASSRELLNLVQADSIGCHIITMTNDLLAKLGTIGRDLTEFSLQTVQMFHDDAARSGYHL
jgi:transaldolase